MSSAKANAPIFFGQQHQQQTSRQASPFRAEGTITDK